MKYLKPIILLVLVFAAGIAVGVVYTRYETRRTIRDAIRQPEMVRTRIVRDLARQLDLDAVQRTKIDEILISTQQQIATAKKERFPRYRLIFADTQYRISEILTPDQRVKFEKIQSEFGFLSPGSNKGSAFPLLQKLKNRREEALQPPPAAAPAPAQRPN